MGEVSSTARIVHNFKNNHMKIGSHQRHISMLGINEIPSFNRENNTTIDIHQLDID